MAIRFDGKVFEKIQLRIKKENALFRKMTKSEQRVTIAKDVIKLLSTKKLAAYSTYLDLGDLDYELSEIVDGDERCRTYAEKYAKVDASLVVEQALTTESCQVCGIGSLFVAALRRNDKMPLAKLIDGYAGSARPMEVKYLKKWFGDAELATVEEYYEQNGNSDYDSPIRQEDDNDKRLKMIMQNIVSNKGRFDPHKGAHKIED